MRGQHSVVLALLAVGVPAFPAPGQPVQAASRRAQAPEWTGPGWYVVEDQAGGAGDAIRAGPFRDRASCASIRKSEFPAGPRGHPELDNLDCRQLVSRPG